MDPGGDFETEREPEDSPLPEPAQHSLGGVALQDPKVLAKDLGEGPVGGSLTVREAAPRSPKRFRTDSPSCRQNSRTSRVLPSARLSEDGHELRATVRDGGLVRPRQRASSVFSPDEARSQPGDSARAHERERPQEAARLDPPTLPLRRENRERAELESPSDRGCRALSDQDLAGLRGLLQARSDVDRVAADE